MKNKKQISYAIKIGVILLLFFGLWYKVSNNQNINDILSFLETTMNDNQSQKFIIVCLCLMPINWLLESFKWQILISKIQKINWIRSYKAILAGVTVSIFTPNRIGEYAGRVLFVHHNNRIQAVFSTLISSIGQLTSTLIFGSISIYLFYLNEYKHTGNSWIDNYLLALLIVMISTLIILFVSTPSLISLLRKLKALRKVKKYVSFFNRYSVYELLKILTISILRYSVYSLQLYLILHAFGVELSISQGITLIPITFFIMTIIPSIALAELGIREAVALTVIGTASDNTIGILSATFMLWTINLVVPAILGSLFILQSRIFKRSNS
ncbi:MAG: lysylphosphatidylglycerol synthase transmembrane domain-containing protein [Salibacteraceae bacterium]